MQKNIVRMGVLALALVLMAGLAACGGGKSVEQLNRETDALAQEMQRLDPLKPSDAAKLTKLLDKGKKLSAELEKAEAQAAAAAAKAGSAIKNTAKSAANSAANSAAKGSGKPAAASDFVVDLNEAGDGVVITGIQKDAKFGAHLVVPAEIEGLPVVAYFAKYDDGMAKARNQPPLESVVLPDTITYMGQSGVVIDDSYDDGYLLPEEYAKFVGISEPRAVFYCESLKRFVFPKYLKIIPERLSLGPATDITWPEALEVIGSYAFGGTQLTELVIPNGVKAIGVDAFKGSKTLTSVTIPDSVEVIYGGAFENCSVLTTVKMPAHPIKYTSWGSGSFVFRGSTKLNLASQAAIEATGHKPF